MNYSTRRLAFGHVIAPRLSSLINCLESDVFLPHTRRLSDPSSTTTTTTTSDEIIFSSLTERGGPKIVRRRSWSLDLKILLAALRTGDGFWSHRLLSCLLPCGSRSSCVPAVSRLSRAFSCSSLALAAPRDEDGEKEIVHTRPPAFPCCCRLDLLPCESAKPAKPARPGKKMTEQSRTT